MGQPAIIERGRATVQRALFEAVRVRYFPELWYAVENWLDAVKPRRILEVGPGRGLLTEALAKSNWDVTAVDPYEPGATRLKQRLAHRKLAIQVLPGDPDNLPFAAASYPAIVSANLLEFCANPFSVTRELARVLSPGGRALVATFNRYSLWGLPPIARLLRYSDIGRAPRALTRAEFVKILKASTLEVEDVIDRAFHLPSAGVVGSVRLPVAGAFVGLLSKPPG